MCGFGKGKCANFVATRFNENDFSFRLFAMDQAAALVGADPLPAAALVGPDPLAAAAQPPPAVHQEQPVVRAVVSLDMNTPVALSLDQNGVIIPVRLGRLLFDEDEDFDSDDDEDSDSDDDEDFDDDDDVKEEDDNGGSSQMDTDEDSDNNVGMNDTDDDDDAAGYESDASVVFLYEVITLD